MINGTLKFLRKYLRIWVQEMKKKEKKFNSVLNIRKLTHFQLCLFGTQVSKAVSVCAEKVERLCHFFSSSFFWTKWWSLSMEGLLSTGPTPSSLYEHPAILNFLYNVIKQSFSIVRCINTKM